MTPTLAGGFFTPEPPVTCMHHFTKPVFPDLRPQLTDQPMPARLSLPPSPLPQHLVSSANNSHFPGALFSPSDLLPSWFSSSNGAQCSGLLDPRRVTLTALQLSQYQGLGTPPGPLTAPACPAQALETLFIHQILPQHLLCSRSWGNGRNQDKLVPVLWGLSFFNCKTGMIISTVQDD